MSGARDWEGEERRKANVLSENQMDEIAERAAEKALQKVYSEVGKGVLRRAAFVVGTAVIALLLWLGSHGIAIK